MVNENEVEVLVSADIVATAAGVETTQVCDDIKLTVDRKEYVITGDDIYVGKTLQESPIWLTNYINSLTDLALSDKLEDLTGLSESVSAAIASLNVAKNAYENSIITYESLELMVNAKLETLNSSLRDADATIINLLVTKVTPDQASALALNAIEASLNNGAIKSTVSRLDSAITTENESRAAAIDAVRSELYDLAGEAQATATATTYLRTRVGIDENNDVTGTGALADIQILQKQNDGVIETYTGTYDVILNATADPELDDELVLTAEPYATWLASEAVGSVDKRLSHIGDVYIKYETTSTGAKAYIGSYKFIRTATDSTSPYSTDADGFTWALIVDQAAQDAYNQALNAYYLADNKRRVFTTTPYGPYDIGDLWTKTVSGGGTLYKATVKRVSGYVASDWVVADDAGLNTFVSTTYTPTVTSLQNQVDGKVESWYTLSTSNPKTAWTDAATRAKHDGDLWYQTDTKLSYWYSSATNAWNLIDDAKAIQALADAATAQATADGIVVSYYAQYQDDAPDTSKLWLNKTGTKVLKRYTGSWTNVVVKEGDTLTAFDPDSKEISIFVYSGSSWASDTPNGLVATSEWGVNLAADLAALDENVYGDTGLKNTLLGEITKEGARVESQFAYDSSLKIGEVNYNSGFGLVSDVAGGVGNVGSIPRPPTGTSEFWVRADRFKMVAASQTAASQTPFSVDAITGDITFNGKVSFNSVTGAPLTYTGKLYTTATQNTTGLAVGTYMMKYDYSLLQVWQQVGQYTYMFIAVTPPVGSTFIATANKDAAGVEVAITPNMLFTYNGTVWVKGAMSTAEIISSINGNTNTTTIDGGKITAGSIRSNQMFSNRLVNTTAYNSDGSINESLVTMDINLASGYIYIR